MQRLRHWSIRRYTHGLMPMRMLELSDSTLAAIDAALGKSSWRSGTRVASIDRFRADVQAIRFHLRRSSQSSPALIAILGGTGTGKSTLLNRLLGADVAAASFRRTFTSGAIAVTTDSSRIPKQWLGVEHSTADASQLPSRGQADRLTVVALPNSNDLINKVTLIDTPDLDGDQPVHHAQAERAFRWADAVVFVVTPEKYQMTELLPYYRLARRYEIPALFVMNKVEEQAVVDDYRNQTESDIVYAVPRDDAVYEPPADYRLDALKQAISEIVPKEKAEGTALRAADLTDRLRDQIIEPARADRREIDRLTKSLRAMEAPSPGVDVNPLTEQLQRRLQQRSVLYLMGPARVLDRVRQVPGILARLPRSTWEWFRSGRFGTNGDGELPADLTRDRPNFQATLSDQFVIVQSRIDDAVRSSSGAQRWIDQSDSDYAATKLSPDTAGQIAEDEIAKLQQWLEKQWNSTPRDTAMIEKLLKLLPGGQKLSKWSEAAPYILTIVVATHHAFFGHIDLLILGGWSLATWLTEKLSNQVASRAREANQTIAARFTELAHRQIEQTCAWLERQSPTTRDIQQVSLLADRISESLQHFPPSPGTPGEGRGGGSSIENRNSQIANPNSPHPNPPPEYLGRGREEHLTRGPEGMT